MIDVEHVILDRRGTEKVVLHMDADIDTDNRSVRLATLVVADRHLDGRIDEVGIYFASRPLIGDTHTGRPSSNRPSAASAGTPWPRTCTCSQPATSTATVAAFEPDG